MCLCVLVARITIETGSVECVLHNLSHGWRGASWETFWQFYYFTTFYFLSCWLVAMAVLKAIVSGEEKPIERYTKTSVKFAEQNKLFSSFQKNIIEFVGLNEQAQEFGLGHLTWNFTTWRKSMAKQRIAPYQHSNNWSWNCPSCLA